MLWIVPQDNQARFISINSGDDGSGDDDDYDDVYDDVYDDDDEQSKS